MPARRSARLSATLPAPPVLIGEKLAPPLVENSHVPSLLVPAPLVEPIALMAIPRSPISNATSASVRKVDTASPLFVVSSSSTSVNFIELTRGLVIPLIRVPPNLSSGSSVPSKLEAERLLDSIVPVLYSNSQSPPLDSLPVMSSEAATSAVVSLAISLMKLVPLGSDAILHP